MLFYGYFGARFERLTVKEFVEFALASAGFLTKRTKRDPVAAAASAAPVAGVARSVGSSRP